MKLPHRRIVLLCCLTLCMLAVLPGGSQADDGYQLWLKYRTVEDSVLRADYARAIPQVIISGSSPTCDIIHRELHVALQGLLGISPSIVNIAPKGPGILSMPGVGNGLVLGTPEHSGVVMRLKSEGRLTALGDEGFLVTRVRNGKSSLLVVAANTERGLLYGTFAFLRSLQTRTPIDSLAQISVPRIHQRLLDHWDNLDGTIERGYGGRSLWKWDQLPQTIDPRYADYARACASIGINGTVLNNVNANPAILQTAYLRKIAALARVFRPYGLRVFLSVNFASPMKGRYEQEGNRKGGIGDLSTADPLDPGVRAWWEAKVQEIYALIPDFGGFLVKANSEGMPGPQDYHRSHADGANMLARALAPYHGIVMWRAFVYDPNVDPDRVKRAAMEFVPLDTLFSPNVFVQAKNGPLDFQPREPVQPLFGSMVRTPVMPELQIAQEYLGHSIHLVYLAPMWKEYFDFDLMADGPGSTLGALVDGTLRHNQRTGIAGVANSGSDRNWCGHFFAQANWYAFGRLAWDHTLEPARIADEWIQMSLTNDAQTRTTIVNMMMPSWEACVNYMEPLGLHHIMEKDSHYGPGPSERLGRDDWSPVYYHHADSIGLGFDRSTTGSNAVSQYALPLRSLFDSLATCPEKYLLWFHHVPWGHRMRSGRTLWEELCRHYYAGTEQVRRMRVAWQGLQGRIDPEIFASVSARIDQQVIDADRWRDVCLSYFSQFSKRPILIPTEKR